MSDRDDTPTERPMSGHDANRPVVFALINVIAPLQESVHLLSALVSEIRRLNSPADASVFKRLDVAGQQIEKVGWALRAAGALATEGESKP